MKYRFTVYCSSSQSPDAVADKSKTALDQLTDVELLEISGVRAHGIGATEIIISGVISVVSSVAGNFLTDAIRATLKKNADKNTEINDVVVEPDEGEASPSTKGASDDAS
jgi:dihydrodipicolinate synthase/N-acetylneuraminate lyase